MAGRHRTAAFQRRSPFGPAFDGAKIVSLRVCRGPASAARFANPPTCRASVADAEAHFEGEGIPDEHRIVCCSDRTCPRVFRPGSFYQGFQPDRRNKSGEVASYAMPLKIRGKCLFSPKEHRHEFQHSTT